MELSKLEHIAEETITKRKPIRILCCGAASCKSSGSETIIEELKNEIEAQGLHNEVEVCPVGCMKFCGRGVLIEIAPLNRLYENVRPEDANSIVQALKGEGEATAPLGAYNHPFFALQMPIVLENSGKINP
ncbi:MAG: (2Fe-2S) ferredoxin domain-containing protein, partial [Geminocystis sp. GBBB08]